MKILLLLFSHVWLFATPQIAACQAFLSVTISQSLVDAYPLSQWCFITISSSIALCFQALQTSRSFPVSWLFASSGQSIGASTLASVLPLNIQCWFPLGLTGLISLLSKGLSRVFSSTIQRHPFFGTQPSLWSSSHIHTWLLEKPWLWLMNCCWQSNASAF